MLKRIRFAYRLKIYLRTNGKITDIKLLLKKNLNIFTKSKNIHIDQSYYFIFIFSISFLLHKAATSPASSNFLTLLS